MTDMNAPTPTPASAIECPVCRRPMKKPHKCKTLFGVTVCNKCRNGFANRRQAAYIVDSLLVIILAQVILLTIIRALVASASSPTASDLLEILWLILSWVLVPLAFTFKDAFGGRSLGKLIFGLRVVDSITRQPITPMQSMRRNLTLMIPYVGVIGGVVTMMKGQRWGEKWAHTMVTWNKHQFRVPFAPVGRFCRSCGYDLTGNISGRCPECGLETPPPTSPPPLPLPAPTQP